MPTVDPKSTFTLNGRKTIVKASDVDDYDGSIVTPHTDYVLRFTIKPTGLHESPTNIIHITTGLDCCDYGTRNPSVYFLKNTTQLLVSTGDRSNGNNLDLWSREGLALNINSDVEIRVFGTVSTLSINEKLISRRTIGDRPILKNLKVYLSSPWWDAADAIISNVYFGPA